MVRLSTKGFTIIEISIALAIAGLIFVIMFGAIPAFLKAGRNNERKQDTAKILDAVSRYSLNHAGDFPTADADTINPTNTKYVLRTTKLSFYSYTASPPEISFTIGRGAIRPPHTAIDSIEVANYQKCDPTKSNASTSRAADYRDIVALYALETKSGPAPQCTQL